MKWRNAQGWVLIALISACATTDGDKSRDLARIYTEMGVTYYKRGEYAQARERLEKAVELQSEYVPAHQVLAEVFNRMNRPKDAEPHYQKALEMDGRNPTLWNNYAVYLCSNNREAESEKYFLKAVSDPDYATPGLAYENLGMCMLRLSEVVKAENYFKEALKHAPKLPNVLVRMTRLKFDKNEFINARAFFQRYMEVGPPTAAMLLLGVQIEQRLGDMATVLKLADTLTTQFPDSPEARHVTALSLAPLGASPPSGSHTPLPTAPSTLEGN